MAVNKQRYIAAISLLSTVAALALIFNIQKDESPELMICRTRLALMEKNEEFINSVIGRNMSAAAGNSRGKTGLIFISGGGKTADAMLRAAAEYYIARMDTTPEMKNVRIIFAVKQTNGRMTDLFKTGRSPAPSFVRAEDPDIFVSLLPSGVNAAIILLNPRGVCIYAHTLEAENSRRIYENSGPITELIRNGI